MKLPVYIYEVPQTDAQGRQLYERSAPAPRVEMHEAGDPADPEAAEAAAVAAHEADGRTVHRTLSVFDGTQPGAQVWLVGE